MSDDKSHQAIREKTDITLQSINEISQRRDPEAMMLISNIAKDWYNDYGKYYHTIWKENKSGKAGELVYSVTNPCPKCGSHDRYKEETFNRHKVRTRCLDCNHHIKWG